MKKRGFHYPDWNNPENMIITRQDEAGRKSSWKEYTQSDTDTLHLCVTVEISEGDPVLFTRFFSKAENDAERKEMDRQAAWRNAICFAEQLWKVGTHREYVVMYRKENPDNQYIREAVCIYRRLPPLTELGAKGGGSSGK